MKTELDIYIEDLVNPKIIVVKDASYYNPNLAVTGAKLDMQYPNSSNYITIPVGKEFSYIINSNTIGLTDVNHSENLSELPDGIYTIKYSICPNKELYVEYSFLRNTKQVIKFNNLYCSIDIDKCSRRKYSEDLIKLRNIKDLIDSAKYLADCGKYVKSIEIYDYVNELLSEFSSDCNCK
jgi:hypothetical protein